MRRSHNNPISPQLYRHFAAVTVILTVAVAVFADGDSNEPTAARAAEARSAAPEPPIKPFFRQPTNTAGDDSPGWGNDDGDGSGVPPTAETPPASQVLPPPLAGIAEPARPAGGDNASAEAAGSAPAPTSAQIAAAEAASRLRSGSPGSD